MHEAQITTSELKYISGRSRREYLGEVEHPIGIEVADRPLMGEKESVTSFIPTFKG
jgi:hypothetical protein